MPCSEAVAEIAQEQRQIRGEQVRVVVVLRRGSPTNPIPHANGNHNANYQLDIFEAHVDA